MFIALNDRFVASRRRFVASRRSARLLLVCAAAWCAFATPIARAQQAGDERGIDPPVRELVPRQLGGPAVALAGGQFLVVWTEQRLASTSPPINQVLAARVSLDGGVLDPRGIAIASAGGLRREPRVVASGDGFIVLWRESRTWASEGARFARIDADGHVLDPEGRTLPFYLGEPGCAGTHCLGASALALDYHVVAFDECGSLGTESPLAIPAPTSSQPVALATAPKIVSNACGHALALGEYDQVSGETSIVLAGYERGGAMRFTRTLQSVETGGTTLPAFDVAANASGELLLVWQQAGDELWSRWTDRDGEPRAPAKRIASGKNPTLAFDGDGFLLLSAGDDALTARQLDADGELLSAEPTAIASQPPGLRDVRAAAGQEGALVVWQPDNGLPAGQSNAARLAADGSLLDPDGLAVAASANRQWGPQLAREGAGYALFYRDDRPDDPGARVATLDAQGVLGASGTSFALDPAIEDWRAVQLQVAGDRRALVLSDEQGARLHWLAPDTGTAGHAVRPIAADGSALMQAQLVIGDGSILALSPGRGRLCGEDQACDTTLTLTVLDADGHADPARPAITFGPDGVWGRSEALAAYDGRGFIVAFRQARVEAIAQEAGVRVIHVEPDGSVLPSEPSIALLAPEQSYDRPVAIAPGGDGYLLVIARTSFRATPSSATLYGLRLDRELTPIDDEAFVLAAAEIERAHVSAVDDGEAWLVAWQERIADGSSNVRGARVARTPGSSATRFNVAVSADDEINPSLAAAAPGHALIAYERFDHDPSAMTGRVFLRELRGSDPCDGSCCDDDCPPPAAEQCQPSAAGETASCGPDEPVSARRARYGCGCHVGARAPAPGSASLLALLALLLLTRRRRSLSAA